MEVQESSTRAPAPPGLYGFVLSTEDKLSKFLSILEVFVLVIISLGVVIGFLIIAIYVVFGGWEEGYKRAAQAMKELDSAWRLLLLLAVPLFFKPVYKFLTEMKEGPFGIKRQEIPPVAASDQQESYDPGDHASI